MKPRAKRDIALFAGSAIGTFLACVVISLLSGCSSTPHVSPRIIDMTPTQLAAPFPPVIADFPVWAVIGMFVCLAALIVVYRIFGAAPVIIGAMVFLALSLSSCASTPTVSEVTDMSNPFSPLVNSVVTKDALNPFSIIAVPTLAAGVFFAALGFRKTSITLLVIGVGLVVTHALVTAYLWLAVLLALIATVVAAAWWVYSFGRARGSTMGTERIDRLCRVMVDTAKWLEAIAAQLFRPKPDMDEQQTQAMKAMQLMFATQASDLRTVANGAPKSSGDTSGASSSVSASVTGSATPSEEKDDDA